MLTIRIEERAEFFNDLTEKFIQVEPRTYRLQHSLVSLSKWESVWRKSFHNTDKRTFAEQTDYLKHMMVTQNVSDTELLVLMSLYGSEINAYINDPHTATTFGGIQTSSGRNEIITSELIYYWMINYNIPIECQRWHLNRLLTLIRVFTVKNSKTKKTLNETYRSNSELNAARRELLNSKG